VSKGTLEERGKQAVSMLLRFGELGSVEGFPSVWQAVKRSAPRQPRVYHAGMQVWAYHMSLPLRFCCSFSKCFFVFLFRHRMQ
jgi:hypothetical protein